MRFSDRLQLTCPQKRLSSGQPMIAKITGLRSNNHIVTHNQALVGS
jgi:hypothetical protein